jgi:N-methylhydantoinase B
MSSSVSDPILLGIQWDRLISICDEIINSLVRTSFSTNVRESYDLSCVIFDARGRAIAQGSYSVPSFTGTAPATLQHFLAKFPPDTLKPGDAIATNDPWLGTGHLYDINVMQPVFRANRLVGYTMSITHLPDVGGTGYGATAREIFEEGFWLPPVKFVQGGKVDQTLLEIIATNVRVPEQTIGDIMANVTCTTVGGRMLCEFLEEYRLDDLEELADGILALSERAMRSETERLPGNRYTHSLEIEGVDGPLRLACAIQFKNGIAHIDFDGSSPSVRAGINVPLCYTRAMACYAIKCLTTPKIPNNEGSVRPIRVVAPPGSLLNALPPSPTGGRHVIGHFVVPLIFGALASIFPDRVQADAGMLNLINVQGITNAGRGISSIFFASGGLGAMSGLDGPSATPGPSNMTGTPIEVWENITDTVVLAKELLQDSGGAGEFRGGLGQRIEMRNDSVHALQVSCLAGRDVFAPQGLLGGQEGRKREVYINQRKVDPKGRYFLQRGDVLTTFEAGGGGFGDKARRSAEKVVADVRAGFLSPAKALEEYGVEVS